MKTIEEVKEALALVTAEKAAEILTELVGVHRARAILNAAVDSREFGSFWDEPLKGAGERRGA